MAQLSIASGLSLSACTNLLVDVGVKQETRHQYFNVELQVLQNLCWIPKFTPEKSDSPLKFDMSWDTIPDPKLNLYCKKCKNIIIQCPMRKEVYNEQGHPIPYLKLDFESFDTNIG